ncbi:unnamed protein product, partial [Brenthis ino]
MAPLNYRIRLTLLVFVNLVITSNCDNVSDEDSVKIRFDDTRLAYDEIDFNANTDSKEYNVTKEESHTTEVTADESEDRRYDTESDVTTQDATETSYTVAIENDVYNNGEDVYNQNGYNQSEPPQATTPPMDEGSQMTEVDEDYESTGQRSPKTETDKQPVENRIFEKPRPIPALSKSSTLKSWLEDSWLRPPAGILVPLRPLALNRALGVWNDLAGEGLNVTDIVIVGYDSNGVNWRSRHNLQPTTSGTGEKTVSDALSKLLLKYQGVYTDSTNDGTMRALAAAAKLVPYDSALFVVTDKGAGDPQRLPLALRALVEKRLKVYTIWTDPNHPSPESELALQDLRNVSSHTEGEVLPYSLQIMDVDSSSNLASDSVEELPQWQPSAEPRRARLNEQPDMDIFDTLLVKRGAGEAITLGIPVENGVTTLRILIEGAVDHAVIYPPNDGPQIDLYNQTSVKMFSPASGTGSVTPRDVFLVFPGATLDFEMLSVLPATLVDSSLVGMWHLSVRCETCDYRLTVSARTDLHFKADVEPRDILKLRVTGTVSSVRESSLVDEHGVELAKLSFSYQPMSETDRDMNGAMANIYADVPMPRVTSSTIYVKIIGRDTKGEPFVRLSRPISQQSEVRMGRSASITFPETINDLEEIDEFNPSLYNEKLQYNDSNYLPYGQATSQLLNQRGAILTSVQIGLSTRLYGAPGSRLQLHFEVTNFREQSVRFLFQAVGELRFLTGIDPTSQTVASGQTATVIVSLLINQNAQPGARDLITFSAIDQSTQQRASMSAYVYVLNQGESIQDNTAPNVRHSFLGSCIGRQGSDCAEHIWSANFVARDTGGLLRFVSAPIGLVYETNFISGTREEVQASYRANCCNPRVTVIAVDAFGNTNSYTVDITNYINEAGIAAIVLGVLLLIIIIILTILLIYWCVKRRKESRELPSYGSRNVS